MEKLEEMFPLMQGVPSTDGEHRSGLRVSMDARKLSGRGIISIFFTVLIVYVIAAAASRAIMGKDDDETDVESFHLAADSATGTSDSLHNLINPINGTHPTLTTTEACTGICPQNNLLLLRVLVRTSSLFVRA